MWRRRLWLWMITNLSEEHSFPCERVSLLNGQLFTLGVVIR